MQYLNEEQKEYIKLHISKNVLDNFDLDIEAEWYKLIVSQKYVFKEDLVDYDYYSVNKIVVQIGERYFQTLKFKSFSEECTQCDMIEHYDFKYEIMEVYQVEVIKFEYTTKKP